MLEPTIDEEENPSELEMPRLEACELVLEPELDKPEEGEISLETVPEIQLDELSDSDSKDEPEAKPETEDDINGSVSEVSSVSEDETSVLRLNCEEEVSETSDENSLEVMLEEPTTETLEILSS